MTKILKTVFKTVIVVLDAFFLPVRFLIGIIGATGIILFAKFIKKVDIGFKAGCLMLFKGMKKGFTKWWDSIIEIYEED